MAQTPFNMTFDEIMARAEKGEPLVVETPASPAQTAPVSTAETSATATSSHTPTFEEMVAQAQANAAGTAPAPVEETPAVKTPAPAVETPVEETPAPTVETPHTPTFDELVAQAQAKAAISTDTAPAKEEVVEETPAKEEVVEETPVKEEIVEETPAKEEVVEETPVKEEVVEDVPVMNPPESAETSNVKEEAKPETSEKEVPKAKPASKSRKKKKTAAPEEKPEDKTEEYRVNLGQETEAKETASVEVATTMERLFSEEEVAALRADIQSFVRKEFKRAMVGAMKELLTEFNDV